MAIERSALRRWFKGTGLVLIALPVLFLLSAWIGSSIPRNSGWEEADPASDEAITILIGHNGIHTEIIMPVATQIIDWRGIFPLGDLRDPERDYTHVGVSWGERTFFLETPTWSDLNLLVAANALTGGDGLLHAAYYVRPAPAEDFRELRISTSEYEALSAQIAKQLVADDRRVIYPGYASHDAFFDAKGVYHLGNTCNQWTSDQLAKAGIETGWWTPLPGGVMKWVPQLGED